MLAWLPPCLVLCGGQGTGVMRPGVGLALPLVCADQGIGGVSRCWPGSRLALCFCGGGMRRAQGECVRVLARLSPLFLRCRLGVHGGVSGCWPGSRLPLFVAVVAAREGHRGDASGCWPGSPPCFFDVD